MATVSAPSYTLRVMSPVTFAPSVSIAISPAASTVGFVPLVMAGALVTVIVGLVVPDMASPERVQFSISLLSSLQSKCVAVLLSVVFAPQLFSLFVPGVSDDSQQATCSSVISPEIGIVASRSAMFTNIPVPSGPKPNNPVVHPESTAAPGRVRVESSASFNPVAFNPLTVAPLQSQ